MGGRSIAELIADLSIEDPFTPSPPDEAALAWTEEDVRAWFASGGATLPAGKKPGQDEVAQMTREEVRDRLHNICEYMCATKQHGVEPQRTVRAEIGTSLRERYPCLRRS